MPPAFPGLLWSKKDSGRRWEWTVPQTSTDSQEQRAQGRKNPLPFTKLRKNTADRTLRAPPFSLILRRPPTPTPSLLPGPQRSPLQSQYIFCSRKLEGKFSQKG